MIVFDLHCRAGDHRFEGWFKSSQDFADQTARGFLCCPECGSTDVEKAVQAPNVGRKGNQAVAKRPEPSQAMSAGGIPPQAVEMMQKLATMQAEALKDSKWVGESFAEDARAMHYGERDHESIHGQTTLEEAKELLDEGIAVAPLPFPVAPPNKAN
ncbi:MAG: DUF1178 family protein [Novosphingobium sp.]|nr:DUF1178 family protein [Novosphingobium sp.]